MRRLRLAGVALLMSTAASAADGLTYAERLGWPSGTRALILHVDDAGMSLDSNRGTIRAVEDGGATSFSVMMPTPWVSQIVRWIRTQPRHDAGLHLTLTSEWTDYRWPPLAGRRLAGLLDPEGALWPTVEDVVRHATPDEVAAEIRAQLERARAMGFEPTHLDSHMGTLFATNAFLEKYLELGIRERIPVMFPGGHNHFIAQQVPDRAAELKPVGERIWAAGLPVLDDLHNFSYDWSREEKVARYVDAIRELRPGVTMMIMHCTEPTEVFASISDSGPSRLGDLEAMLDPRVRQAIEEEGIVLTTWRELMERRTALALSTPKRSPD
ncbi:MAG TPA: polysaccharide deacetylase family protein [Pseudomonadales bacterium]